MGRQRTRLYAVKIINHVSLATTSRSGVARRLRVYSVAVVCIAPPTAARPGDALIVGFSFEPASGIFPEVPLPNLVVGEDGQAEW